MPLRVLCPALGVCLVPGTEFSRVVPRGPGLITKEGLSSAMVAPNSSIVRVILYAFLLCVSCGYCTHSNCSIILISQTANLIIFVLLNSLNMQFLNDIIHSI